MNRDALLIEILELASACQSGGATDDDRARLERLLEDSEEARILYLQLTDETVTLNDIRRPTAASAAVATADPVVISEAPQGRSARRGKSWLMWALAGSLAGAALAGWQFFARDPGDPAPLAGAAETPTAPPAFARVVSLSDVKWSAGATAVREWQRIGLAQEIKIDSGSVEILYDNGVQFVMQGPADCRFTSPSEVTALAGKLVARVGPEATGFQIVSPHATVVDRGTSFGMTIDPDRQTDVVVYEGKVDLSLASDADSAQRRLAAGEAMRIDRDGRMGRIASVAGNAFLAPPRMSDPHADDGRVIRAVTDNLKSSDTAKYYRVVARGFREDCQAFVDREHQWNGVDERGLPAFLDHGDYVMTFNDDKVQPNLQIAVELALPARLYLLVDDRATPPPAWLTESFVDTGIDVGVDELHAANEDHDDLTTDVGPGRSIDWSFSVWMQVVEAPSTVLVGSLQQEEPTRPARDVELTMYGIVATPLADGVAPTR
jgi:hypothetical protein